MGWITVEMSLHFEIYKIDSLRSSNPTIVSKIIRGNIFFLLQNCGSTIKELSYLCSRDKKGIIQIILE